jgi:hypothetical protein
MADEQEFSMWELGSGLPLEGARVHSTDAVFTYNNEYAANAVVLDITWQHEDDTIEAQHQLYSVGQKWEPLNEGESVGHQSGKASKFNDQSNIGRLIKSYIESRGGGNFDKGLAIVIPEGIEPNHIAMWIGLDVTLKSIEFPGMGKNPDGSVKMSRTMVIDVYHGRVGDEAPAKAPAKAASKAKAAAPAAESNGGGDDYADHLGQALYRKLKKLAADSADHDAFMDAAFALDDVSTDDKAWNKATERIILNSDDDSLFASAR